MTCLQLYISQLLSVLFDLNSSTENGVVWGRLPNVDQSEARKHCFLVSDRLEFQTLPKNTVLYGYLLNFPSDKSGGIQEEKQHY